MNLSQIIKKRLTESTKTIDTTYSKGVALAKSGNIERYQAIINDTAKGLRAWREKEEEKRLAKEEEDAAKNGVK